MRLLACFFIKIKDGFGHLDCFSRSLEPMGLQVYHLRIECIKRYTNVRQYNRPGVLCHSSRLQQHLKRLQKSEKLYIMPICASQYLKSIGCNSIYTTGAQH